MNLQAVCSRHLYRISGSTVTMTKVKSAVPVPGDYWRLFRLGLTVYMLMLSSQLSLRLRCRTGGALPLHCLCTLLT